ncbi:MAG: hypothetical protein HFJ42_09655 [Clostridia bacterium]|nr:hypothetical protein [Clostridia bacterium]
MENASKALIMAGSILISIMVITLLVMGYNNLTETMNAKNDEDAVEQVTQFNKQYDVYYRNNLYGSDILSLANKVDDYNERQSKEQGYAKLDMEVTFTKSINAYNNEMILNKNESPYNAQQINNKLELLQTKLDRYEGKNAITVGKQKIPSLSGLRSNELEKVLESLVPNISKEKKEEVQEEISKYLGYSSALTNLKSKTFKATKFEYDETTKRITKMIFKEN